METLADELIAILDREADLYGQVLDLAREEQQALLSGPPDAVLGVVRRKDTLLLKIRTVDESRDLICTRLARRWGLSRKTLVLSEILEHCDAAAAERIAAVRDRLRDCVDRLGQTGRMNAVLCHSGIEAIRRVMEDLSVEPDEASPGGAMYERTGSSRRAARRATLDVRT